jgi:hypothetical protein
MGAHSGTAKATEDIARRVLAIQGDTTAAVTAIEEISAIVAQISDRQTTIASAVEEQTATTNEMSRSVSEAASDRLDIAGRREVSGVDIFHHDRWPFFPPLRQRALRLDGTGVLTAPRSNTLTR